MAGQVTKKEKDLQVAIPQYHSAIDNSDLRN